MTATISVRTGRVRRRRRQLGRLTVTSDSDPAQFGVAPDDPLPHDNGPDSGGGRRALPGPHRVHGPPRADLGRAPLASTHPRATVPFENLDVFARTGVRVGRDWSIPKIVERHRGGWCFELNGAFSALLDALGFAVTLHSGQVDTGGGALGPALDHLVLVITLDGRRFLVDVGFGDSALAPLDLG